MRHRPAGGRFDLFGRGFQREKVRDVITAAISRGVQFEVNLVNAVNEMDSERVPVDPMRQSFGKTGWKPHLKEAALAMAGVIVEPVGWEIQIFGDLAGGPSERRRQRFG